MLTTILLLTLSGGLGGPPAQERDALDDAARERLRAHYARVEDELLAEAPPLDPATCAARARTIAVLRAYRERGDFGRWSGPEGQRKFLFVDDGGRRCAVAELLHAWGEDELVERVRARSNEALVAELREDAELRAWLARTGLTVQEAARIQAPAPNIEPPQPPRTWNGPSAGPSSPTTPSRGGGGGTVALPSTPGKSTGPATGGPGRSGAGPRTLSSLAGDAGLWTHWWTWWEFNKLDWLRPNRDAWKSGPADDGRTSARGGTGQLRARAGALAAAALDDDDARVRAAAVVAHARLNGEAAVDDVVAALEDPQQDVRVAAVLALGATDSFRAAHALLRIAHTGALEGEIAPNARFHAHLALGLMVSRGALDPRAVALPSEDGALLPGEATALFQTLATSVDEDVRERIRELSGLFDERGLPRRDPAGGLERAVEALRFDDPETVRVALLRALGSRDLDVRRSAATALGELDDRQVLPVLLTAFETEKEALARGLLLIAIGSHGGAEARDFLVHTLRRGPKGARPWCALALGILAGEDGDEEARAALRAAYAKERNVDARGAYLLAFGIGRDRRARDILSFELSSKTELVRANAAIGLALTGADEAAALLRGALAREPAPLGRSTIAQALGLLGLDGDEGRLVDLLRTVGDPVLTVQHAAAAAFHGSPGVVEGLLETLADGAPAATRAGALQALGMLLDEAEPFRFAALSRRANFAALPHWLNEPLRTTL